MITARVSTRVRNTLALLGLSTALTLAACRQAPGEPTSVRVANGGQVDFESVTVEFPQQIESYGPVPAGAASEYRPVGLAYRHAYVEVRFAGGQAVLQPIDYVGEIPLAGGRFTYRLTIASPSNQQPFVNLEFIEE